jgi:hypothetical protein
MIDHGFIKDDMLGSLDSLSVLIVINNILKSLGKTEKNAGACIREKLVGSSWASGKSINSTTKHTKGTKIGFVAGAELSWRRGIVAMWGDIIETKEVVESVRPKFWRKRCTGKHGANTIGKRAMRAFARTILMGRIRGGRLDMVASIGEKLDDIVAATEFTAKIKANITIRSGSREAVKSQP